MKRQWKTFEQPMKNLWKSMKTYENNETPVKNLLKINEKPMKNRWQATEKPVKILWTSMKHSWKINEKTLKNHWHTFLLITFSSGPNQSRPASRLRCWPYALSEWPYAVSELQSVLPIAAILQSMGSCHLADRTRWSRHRQWQWQWWNYCVGPATTIDYCHPAIE